MATKSKLVFKEARLEHQDRVQDGCPIDNSNNNSIVQDGHP